MDPFLSSLKNLPSEKLEELKAVTEKIVATGMAEIIILFGSYARGNFKKENEGRRQSDFDLLLICSTAKNKSELGYKLQDAFKDITTPVQLVVETISRVNSNLEERQYFFSDICNEGVVLYDTKKETLAAPMDLSPTRRREIAEEDFKNWYGIAYQFFQTGLMHIEKGWNRLASFNLQQTVEMCYTAIEMVFAHYNPHEHNLNTLRKRVVEFDKRINDPFPLGTEAGVDLFNQLNFAYIGGRYRTEEEFPVNKEQLDYWEKETEKLLQITETICQDHIERLKQLE